MTESELRTIEADKGCRHISDWSYDTITALVKEVRRLRNAEQAMEAIEQGEDKIRILREWRSCEAWVTEMEDDDA